MPFTRSGVERRGSRKVHHLHFSQVEESSARLKRGSQHESCTEEEKRPMMGKQRNTDRTTRLLVMILVLFIVAELPVVCFSSSSWPRIIFSLSGYPWSPLRYLGETVLP
jgi:hypothetical protein